MVRFKDEMGNPTLKRLGLLSLATLVVFLCISSHLTAWVDEEKNPTLVEERTPVLERNTSLPEQEQQTPQYVPGEVLVKFKEGVEPQAVLEEVDLETTGIERVHSIAPAVTKFKKDYKLEKDEDGWYWFRGKNYQEVEEIPNEELFNQAYQQMSPEEQALYHIYKINLPESVSVAEAVAQLSSSEQVDYAEPNYIMQAQMIPNDPYYHTAGSWGQSYDDFWGLKIVNVEQAWDIPQAQGEGVVVAVIDTGVDYTHPDLSANMWQDAQGHYGYDFFNNDSDPMDDNGHGTHCAGIIAAVGDNGIGVIGSCIQGKDNGPKRS